MITKLESFNQSQLKKNLPDIRPGDAVRVYQKIKEEGKERIQIFEGLVIAKKRKKGPSTNITVRKVLSGVGVERIFPIHSPAIEKIEIIKKGKVRKAKLYYLKTAKGKRARLKKEFIQAIAEPVTPESKVEEQPAKTTEEKPTESVENNQEK